MSAAISSVIDRRSSAIHSDFGATGTVRVATVRGTDHRQRRHECSNESLHRASQFRAHNQLGIVVLDQSGPVLGIGSVERRLGSQPQTTPSHHERLRSHCKVFYASSSRPQVRSQRSPVDHTTSHYTTCIMCCAPRPGYIYPPPQGHQSLLSHLQETAHISAHPLSSYSHAMWVC